MDLKNTETFLYDYIYSFTPKISQIKCEEYSKLSKICKEIKEEYSKLDIKI